MNFKSKSLNRENQVEVCGRLNPEFAGKLLDLELQLEDSADFSSVTQALELYKQAIEFFASKGDSRALIFQKRMQTTLLKPEVQSTLRRRPASPKCLQDVGNQLQHRKVYIELARLKKSCRYEPVFGRSSPASSTVTRHQVANDRACQKVTTQLKQQSVDLAQRLRCRAALKLKAVDSCERENDRLMKCVLLG